MRQSSEERLSNLEAMVPVYRIRVTASSKCGTMAAVAGSAS